MSRLSIERLPALPCRPACAAQANTACSPRWSGVSFGGRWGSGHSQRYVILEIIKRALLGLRLGLRLRFLLLPARPGVFSLECETQPLFSVVSRFRPAGYPILNPADKGGT